MVQFLLLVRKFAYQQQMEKSIMVLTLLYLHSMELVLYSL